LDKSTERYVAEVRNKAAKQRVIARECNDGQKAHEIFKRAADLEQQARDIEKNE
jgi:F420-dependent methylenetetrahydromethanopterin dehydrogenase